MRDKLRSWMEKWCDWAELGVAVLVGMGLVYCLARYLLSCIGILPGEDFPEEFLHFLEGIFNFVVGIEFIKMLLKPSAETVIEVLVFLVARHMIIGSNSALDILLSVLSIAALYGLRCLLRRFAALPLRQQKEAQDSADTASCSRSFK